MLTDLLPTMLLPCLMGTFLSAPCLRTCYYHVLWAFSVSGTYLPMDLFPTDLRTL